jgi:oligoendopeptidase F
LERIFSQARYQLSGSEEKIIRLKSATSHTKWTELTSKFLSRQSQIVTLSDGSTKVQTLEQLRGLTSDQNKTVRDEADAAFGRLLYGARDIAEAELNAVMANHNVDDELRGFPRPDSARHLADDVSTAIVDAMLETVVSRNDIAHRFYRLKADLLKLPTLGYHERNVEYGAIDREYDWDTSCYIANEVFSELDSDFGRLFRDYLRRGRFDVFPRPGKSGGGWCSAFTRARPIYIFLNHTNTFEDVITLIHEFGHALNYHYMLEEQNSLNISTAQPFTAEVASIYFEDFGYDHLLVDADEETRLVINMTRLNRTVNLIHRQVGGVRFEQKLHATFRSKGYLAAEEISQLFTDELVTYMGPAATQTPGAGDEWIIWPHLRRIFYTYSYASGMLISKAMQRAARQNPAFLTEVKGFLSAGTSASPQTIFARMGIDINDREFWHNGLKEIDELLTQTEKLAVKLGKVSAAS